MILYTLYGKTLLIILNNYWGMNVQWDFGNSSPVIRYSPDANLVPIYR
jgi:hypothetical protein